MNLIGQMLRNSLILTILLLTLLSLSADWFFEQGSPTDWLNDCVLLLEAQQKGEQLARETESSVTRLFVKEQIAEAVKNGEMKLIDAAAFFRWLHEDPKSWHNPERPRPGLMDSAAWCREVIEWTERYTRIEQSSSASLELRRRLEAELQVQLKRQGTLMSPN